MDLLVLLEQDLGKIVAFATTVVAVVTLVWKYFLKPTIRLYKKTAQTFKIIEESVPTLAGIAAQFKPNGGHSLRDIIDRIEVELEMLRGRQRAMLESSKTAMFEADSSGSCLWVNQAWRDLAGLTDTQSLGGGWSTAVLEEDRRRVYDEWVDSVVHQRDFDSIYSFRNVMTGKIHKVRGYGRVVVDKSSKHRTYIGTVTEV